MLERQEGNPEKIVIEREKDRILKQRELSRVTVLQKDREENAKNPLHVAKTLGFLASVIVLPPPKIFVLPQVHSAH